MWNYIKPYLFYAACAAVFMVGEVSMDLLQPGLMSRIVDDGVLGVQSGGVGDVQLILTLGAAGRDEDPDRTADRLGTPYRPDCSAVGRQSGSLRHPCRAAVHLQNLPGYLRFPDRRGGRAAWLKSKCPGGPSAVFRA